MASEEGDGATGHAGPPPLAPGPAQVPEAIPAQGPRVTGVLCPDEHLCSLRDQHCRTCGQPIDAGTELVSGPRPALGILVFDDGETVDLEVPVVVGREVPADYEVDGQQPRIVNMIEEGEPTVSRVHLEIRLDDWTVNMVDQISSNGTFIRAGAATHHRTRIPAGHATPIDIGTYVEVGERWFLFTTRAEL
ncbi:MAG: FHA domain-containing protein [Actinomycetia bacterium]|nr:FHA domain-containing protein [Actinomycetes bacterium]